MTSIRDSSVLAAGLSERAWLSFARQLERAEPADWRCLAVIDESGNGILTKLYLQLSGKGWWSFRSLLDRPTPAMMERSRVAAKRRRSSSLRTLTLSEVADYPSEPSRRALQRALRAIRARLNATVEKTS